MHKSFSITCFSLLSLTSLGQGYNIIGDSYAQGDDCFVLTPAQLYQSGAIWYNTSVDLNDPFEIQFTANFGALESGADGMVFVFQQVSSSVLGADGGGMGFSGFAPSLGVEFDIYQNGDFGDPFFDHIALLQNGNVNHNNGTDNLAGPIQASPTNVNIEDGEDHVVAITWDPQTLLFSIFFDCEQRIAVNIDLINNVFDGDPIVFWGFTGATGGQFAEISMCLDPYILGLPETITACPGDEVELQLTQATTGTYAWEPAEFLDDPTSPSPVATVFETTTFTVTYTDLCGSVQTASTTIEIEFLDVDLGPDQTICPGQEVEIVLPGPYDFEWSDGTTGNSNVLKAAGTYWVLATEGNCFGSDTITIFEGPGIDEVIFITSPAVCGNADGSLEILGVEGGSGPFVFEVGNQVQSDSIFTGLDGGNYTLTVTSQDGCVVTYDFTIESISLSIAGFTANPTFGTAPLKVEVMDTSAFRTDLLYLLGADFFQGTTTSFVFDEPGIYELTQIVWNNSFLCSDTASVQIIVDANVEVIVPSVITPNGDGKNDTFVLSLAGVAAVTTSIFNRWGNLVYERDLNVPEDGMLEVWKPEDISDGVYFYLIKGFDLNGQRIVKEGSLQVLK
jgi:PKD repeat protein